MITGKINEDLEPLLDDISIEGKNRWFSLRTILDSGFNGAFCFPRKYESEVRMERLCEVEVELANGKCITENVYLGKLIVSNQPYLVEMTMTDSETALMGMGMLLEKEAVFNLRTMTIKVS